MNYSGSSGSASSFQAVLDIESQGVDFEKSDRLSVWFSHTDRAGNLLSGQATELMPLDVYIVWMAYEPTPISIEATPYRPVLGETITVELTLQNIGYLSGSTTVSLLDADGLVLGEANFTLESNQAAVTTWSVEAWKEGRLGMMIQLDDDPFLIPVPLADVTQGDLEAKSSKSELGLNVFCLLYTSPSPRD